MKRIQCDVLVVGGGGAGLMAAYSATKHNVKVALVNKGKVQRTGVTIMAPGAIAAVDDRWKKAGDSKGLHMEDTVRGGGFINNAKMVKEMVDRSPDLVLELEHMGALMQREPDGKQYMLRIDGGHSYSRCPFIEDRVGKEMVKAMASALAKRNVDLYENIIVTRLLVEGGRIAGAAGISVIDLEPVLFECTSVILATGGSGSVYANTDNSIDMTGDGFALALKAGARLRDMEFVQFYPIGLLFPPALKGMLGGLCYYCRLYNSKGERFMEKYDPEKLELSTRDRVSRAIMQEVKEGRGSPCGGVYMDLTFNEPGFIARMTPALYATYRNIGIDPEKEMIEIAPTAHFIMGGMDVNEKWETNVKGLFGAGEVCGGMHGGNRLSQNALAEVLVSGSIAGGSAALYSERAERTEVDPGTLRREIQSVDTLLNSRAGLEAHEIKAKLKTIMWEKVGVTRNEQQLKEAYREICSLEKEPVFVRDKVRNCNRSISEAFELNGMLTASKSIVISASERRESRAAHFRSDYPETDDKNYLVNILLQLRENELVTSVRKVETANLEGVN
ncbi:MAG: FAD-binding protein [Lawsonibacter sp.]